MSRAYNIQDGNLIYEKRAHQKNGLSQKLKTKKRNVWGKLIKGWQL